MVLSEIPLVHGEVLELGSGGGFLRDVFPNVTTSDVMQIPGVDLQVDARRLPFADGSLRAIVGTNVVHRTLYERIAAKRAYFGDFDPFGDFDLLFGAAMLHAKIVDVPIRYRERVYGETNISRFRHGLLLFKMLGIAAAKLKFR